MVIWSMIILEIRIPEVFFPQNQTLPYIHMYTYLEMKARQKRGQNYITGITANYAGTLEDSFVFMTKKH